jgi:hypothetical protein
MNVAPVAVVETPDFIAATRKLMTDEERGILVDHLASNPLAGDLIRGTGGMRKLRWALEGRGKRGGARVIYYFHDERVPLFALDAYAKNEKTDLKPDEVVRLKRVVDSIREAVAKRSESR